MAENIEHITRPLAASGTLSKSVAYLFHEDNEIVISLTFSAPDLTSEVYDTVLDELQRDNFRLGSLNIRREG